MTNEEKMLAGKLYDPEETSLQEKRMKAHRLCQEYNALFDDETAKRQAVITELIPDQGEHVFFQGPIFFDYGCNTKVGNHFYANFNLTVLDTCPVILGDNEFLGPNITLATPLHALLPAERNAHEVAGKQVALEYGKPLKIEDNCWLGSNVVVNGGVTIGAGSVIGSGSVVTRDIPAGVLAVGNPCRVLRPITEADRLELKKELW
ncbi:MAG TPA: sugar O-acetyltransferase [Candidatus Ligilactobacillus excrementipullorum]|nr:sugar O-acetyltransferase [Candidatus Ligilactobacillus excrementipullorum]